MDKDTKQWAARGSLDMLCGKLDQEQRLTIGGTLVRAA